MPTQTALQCVPLPALDPEHIPIASQVLALFGRAAELHPLVLQSLFLRAARGERLGVVVGDNRLNGYALARLARRYGFDPSALLAQIEFSRPFTCHQLHHGVVDLVPERARTWRALYVLGLLETFWDEDIRYPIAARLLDEILSRLGQIAMQNLPVLVTVSPPPKETTRQEFITRVLRAADVPAWQPPPSVVEHVAEQMSMW
jgi:hypothetical protein